MQEDCGPGLSAFIFVAWCAVYPPDDGGGEGKQGAYGVQCGMAMIYEQYQPALGLQ
jgi:hypothetical protein